MEKNKKKRKYDIGDLEKAYKNKQVFDAYVKEVDDLYNLHCVFADGVEGIIPREEVSSIVEDDGFVDKELCLKKKDKIMQVCLKELVIQEGVVVKAVLSRRELEMKVRRWMYANLKAGMKLKGIVRGMTDYAAFVDVGGGVIGMLKREEISRAKIQKPADKLRLGQRLECTVIKYDRDTGKIDLSIRDKEKTFAELIKQIKEGDIVEGVVRNRNRNGLFIELKNGLVGMSEHVSGIEYGQKVLVHIKKINEEKEKIKFNVIG